MGHDQLQRGDTINRQIEQVVREAGMGHLYKGDHDIARMLRHPGLRMEDERERHFSDVFALNLGDEIQGSKQQALRYFASGGEVLKLQYKVQTRFSLFESYTTTAFMFEPDGRLYGNFVDAGHDFEIDPRSRELKIRGLDGGMWEHTLQPYPEYGGVIMVPREIQNQYGPMRLADVEFKEGTVKLIAALGKYKSITFVLPTEVYQAR